MNSKIKSKIYNAQSIGNVEPIEYMIPYPSMRSLIEGQNIKYSKQIIIEKPSITNQKFYSLVQKTAHWLESLGLQPKQRIIIPELDYPQSEILLYGIWHLGAIAVLAHRKNIDELKIKFGVRLLIEDKINLLNYIKDFPEKYDPRYKPLLDDEALVTFENGHGIKLSHYNLLVNVHGIQKAICLKTRTRIFCNFKPISTTWVIFKAILPIYCGCIFDSLNPEISIGEENNDYNIRFDLKDLAKFAANDIAICPENTAVLSFGKTPLHLTDYNIENDFLRLKGHSVMMGYLDNSLNESSFHSESLNISI